MSQDKLTPEATGKPASRQKPSSPDDLKQPDEQTAPGASGGADGNAGSAPNPVPRNPKTGADQIGTRDVPNRTEDQRRKDFPD